MQQNYTSLGLMSGTSGDGVDASIIKSNGIDSFEIIKNRYFQYDAKIYKEIHAVKEKISNLKDLIKYSKDLKELERKITLFHASIINEMVLKDEDIIVGFHGQTIYHNAEEKISNQLGNGRLLSQLTKKKIIFNFRQNDILNGGQGAPLAPIFHQLITLQMKIKLPVIILNIGGISNVTIILKSIGYENLYSQDIGPGNCLIDDWVRKNSSLKFDKDGKLSSLGKTNEIILEQAQELYANRKNKQKKSFDTGDFDISFLRGLSLEDGASTLSDFTAGIMGESLIHLLKREKKIKQILMCGGGRKNKNLINAISKNLPSYITLKSIDEYGIDGDFIESQAFAFLAIRSIKRLPISYPNTTNCKKPSLGGELIDS